MEIKLLNYVSALEEDNLHRHEGQYEFHYCVEGKGFLINKGNKIKLIPGVLTITYPGVKHKVFIPSDGSPVSFYYIVFTLDHSDPEEKALSKLLKDSFSKKENIYIESRLRFLFEHLKNRQKSENKLMKKSANHQMFTLLYDICSGHHENLKLESGGVIANAIEYMQSKVHEKIKVEEISSLLNLDKSYFIRLYSMGFFRFIMEYKFSPTGFVSPAKYYPNHLPPGIYQPDSRSYRIFITGFTQENFQWICQN